MGRIRVDVGRAGAVGVARSPVLVPERRAPEVVEDRVEVVLRRRQPEHERVPESEDHGHAEDERDRLRETIPERTERVAQARPELPSPPGVDDQGRRRDREPEQERPPFDPAEERERPEDEHELRPGDDVRADEERRRPGRREASREPERARRQERRPGEERERSRHRPLAEKCW